MNKQVKEECIKRLNILKKQGLLTDIDIIRTFENGNICISEPNMVLGMPCVVIFSIKNKPSYEKLLKEKIIPEMSLLQLTTKIPYFGIVQNTSLGLLFNVFYASDDPDEWEMEREELISQNLCVFCYNIDKKFGEYGYIDYEMVNGGPIRTA